MLRSLHVHFGFALCAVLAAVGCQSGSGDFKELDPKAAAKTAPVIAEPHHHDEPGPHGGHVLEFGEFHGELVLEADRKLTVYLLSDDLFAAAPVKDAQAVAKLEVGGQTVDVALAAAPFEGEADGNSSRFQSAGPAPDGIQDAEGLAGKIVLTLGDKSIEAPIAHDHDHDHGGSHSDEHAHGGEHAHSDETEHAHESGGDEKHQH